MGEGEKEYYLWLMGLCVNLFYLEFIDMAVFGYILFTINLTILIILNLISKLFY